ncbi:uncharacterized protein LOC114718014 isoform X2 [Neltuma alba]|uniref:uncharacterized protein LOC114718014 isoform X2 n=1 Tax=Neltuma alba TaxID=207710 RepID=UPI0010A45CA6|nr:uncharacterized protein LOC114718014 isoform X2 [Prosopis alba]
MCDSLVMPSALRRSDSSSEYSRLGASYCDSEFQADVLSELHCGDISIRVRSVTEETERNLSHEQGNSAALSRFQLEQDNLTSLQVQQLENQLLEEVELHAFLENVLERNVIRFSGPANLPHHVQGLLSDIAQLESTISKLENEMVSLHFQLSQERNERRLVEYRLRHLPSQLTFLCSSEILSTPMSYSLRSSKQFDCEGLQLAERCFDQVQKAQSSKHSCEGEEPMMENAVRSVLFCCEKNESTKIDGKYCQPADFRKLPKGMPPKELWNWPNLLSEEMVRCMKNIYISLSDSGISMKSFIEDSQYSTQSPCEHLPNSLRWSSSEHSTSSSWVQSPLVDVKDCDVLASGNACDPYHVRGKLSWADIGSYGSAIEVSWMSVGKKQLEYAAGALRRFRLLVEQLAKANPIHLTSSEKLAFWINLYNALIMHAYLAYGVPRSDLKLFSLLQKAAYTVGGHSFSAAAIEYVILKMKPPLHRPQIALLLAVQKFKVSEEQRKFAIGNHEPLVAFALSCGMYSSPAVRIYTAKNVREELEDAQRDYIRAAVGVSSKGRLLVPKMLHCFAKSFADDASLAVWISHYLPPSQAAFVEQCMSQRRQSFLGSRNCAILSFDSRFRYLFLPDTVPSSTTP